MVGPEHPIPAEIDSVLQVEVVDRVLHLLTAAAWLLNDLWSVA